MVTAWESLEQAAERLKAKHARDIRIGKIKTGIMNHAFGNSAVDFPERYDFGKSISIPYDHFLQETKPSPKVETALQAMNRQYNESMRTAIDHAILCGTATTSIDFSSDKDKSMAVTVHAHDDQYYVTDVSEVIVTDTIPLNELKQVCRQLKTNCSPEWDVKTETESIPTHDLPENVLCNLLKMAP